jgi:hypothetical protein
LPLSHSESTLQQKGADLIDDAEVTDVTIGAVLACTPHDPTDDAWPHRAVRGAPAPHPPADETLDKAFVLLALSGPVQLA